MSESYVNYEDFGAIGDGKHDDFDAIAAAHEYANANGLTVRVSSDKTYYVGEKLTREIPIKYDVDFGGASFIIDDAVPNAFEYRTVYLFAIRRDRRTVIEGEAIKNTFGNAITVKKGDTAFPWLAPALTEDSYVRITNDEHKDFVRFGSNQNNGISRQEVFEVTAGGVLSEDTDVAFDFDKITKIEIFPAHERQITVKNGNFASICCRSAEETNFKNLYKSHNRGFYVERADVLFENMTHKMLDEPPLVTDSGMDGLSARYGERNESYPYQGFIVGYLSNRLTIKNCMLTSHTTYYEDKPATVSTGWKVPNPVPMGSYDLYFHFCNHVSMINLKHKCETGINDRRYWGIMASNNCKNFYIDGCEMNRFDAHRGFWNAVIENTTFGFAINLTGGGKLYLENVTKLGGHDFFSIRGDYGASFEGTVYLKNCRHNGIAEYNSVVHRTGAPTERLEKLVLFRMVYTGSGELFYNWDFGYELFLPINVTVENFTHGANGPLYLYSSEPDERFDNPYRHQHALTSQVTLRGTSEMLKVAEKDECTILNSIPITVET